MEISWTPTLEMRKFLAAALLISSFLIPTAPSFAANSSLTFQAEVWVDNWFALYINGKKVGEDSVAYNTERSFNSSLIKFTASYPFQVGVIARDFMENESGLEYIGKSNQQIGDAGFVMQIREVKSGNIVASTSSSWKTLVLQKAPTNPECVSSSQPLVDCKRYIVPLPAGWSSRTYKDSSWGKSSEFSAQAVGVKDGYFDYQWAAASKLIWSSDLRLDNTILLRKLVLQPSSPTKTNASVANFTLTMPSMTTPGQLPKEYTCDGPAISPTLAWEGVPEQTKSLVLIMNTIPGPPRPGEIENPNHAYLILYNIPPATRKAMPPSYPGLVGMNFKDKSPGYTPPCSQGPGAKTYDFTLYALSAEISLPQNQATEINVVEAMKNFVLAKATLSTSYMRS